MQMGHHWKITTRGSDGQVTTQPNPHFICLMSFLPPNVIESFTPAQFQALSEATSKCFAATQRAQSLSEARIATSQEQVWRRPADRSSYHEPAQTTVASEPASGAAVGSGLEGALNGMRLSLGAAGFVLAAYVF
ncbi:MAG: hypothetical protein NW217_12255 [Hyphomicrobiaceae bacterium]|nr:hypothetical protein [Hyphomicrobiaceae bacterium]